MDSTSQVSFIRPKRPSYRQSASSTIPSPCPSSVLGHRAPRPRTPVTAPTVFLLAIAFIFIVQLSSAQDILSENNFIGDHDHDFGCGCMEYWSCITRGGNPYSYCGIHAHEVCCFIPRNAEPIGILPTPSRSRCGKKGFDGGHSGEADMSEWPWHAAILEKPQDLYVCGSTLLDESWILTAAHCVDDYLPFVATIDQILKVRLGEYDVSTTAEPLRHEEFNISHIVIHPGFNNSTLVHDIALLKLERPAKRKQNIDVVCMPKPGDFEHHEKEASSTSNRGRAGGARQHSHTNESEHQCYVTGWGRRSETSEHSLVLKEINVPLWDHDHCNGALQAQFGPAYHLPDTALCAGAEGRDACDGDGGGPLVCEKNGQWYQVGIVSFGIGCGRRNVPGVYTRVSAYENWIEETILKEKNRSQAQREGRHNRFGGGNGELRQLRSRRLSLLAR
eukprot:snap_masked-scaffold676_size113663-processed-gene-0.19 protein:Tk06496 transcript:snap_masked-scaffold676_size113663-processed-gene-0.19-mRNA-1 annotation:"serine proteinase stubble"